MFGFSLSYRYITPVEKQIILDNRQRYFNSISDEPKLVRLKKKIKYINHVNKKKRTIIIK